MTKNLEEATFAAGCFWGVEERFRTTNGVVSTEVGYTGGTVKDPSYELVCTGSTGHAEAVHITYDPEVITYEELVKIFFDLHDPTTTNRQGPDVGTQYRSVIFYHDDAQQKIATKVKSELEEGELYGAPIVTEIVPAEIFYRAEEYHQQYVKKTGRNVC